MDETDFSEDTTYEQQEDLPYDGVFSQMKMCSSYNFTSINDTLTVSEEVVLPGEESQEKAARYKMSQNEAVVMTSDKITESAVNDRCDKDKQRALASCVTTNKGDASKSHILDILLHHLSREHFLRRQGGIAYETLPETLNANSLSDTTVLTNIISCYAKNSCPKEQTPAFTHQPSPKSGAENSTAVKSPSGHITPQIYQLEAFACFFFIVIIYTSVVLQPVISALRRWRQEDLEFKASFGYIMTKEHTGCLPGSRSSRSEVTGLPRAGPQEITSKELSELAPKMAVDHFLGMDSFHPCTKRKSLRLPYLFILEWRVEDFENKVELCAGLRFVEQENPSSARGRQACADMMAHHPYRAFCCPLLGGKQKMEKESLKRTHCGKFSITTHVKTPHQDSPLSSDLGPCFPPDSGTGLQSNKCEDSGSKSQISQRFCSKEQPKGFLESNPCVTGIAWKKRNLSCLGVTGLLLPRGRRVLGCLIIGLGKDINPNLRAGEMAQQKRQYISFTLPTVSNEGHSPDTGKNETESSKRQLWWCRPDGFENHL
ncbi:AKNA domain containing 1 [Cricetulus griseus]